ncbi:sulfate anion transporter 1 [Ornithorhynchus anatinus]|uniref:Sulfate transporter n=1 Tax=Ornithorhynchus anatinus TaxID=9258 RepID=A0A6I8P8K3_ORNAN|nr:sulfate anion transporter 1 [Ornithorhynchus anatinus]XP_007671013.2 sulfate anion transporter 1 [Ornithorhynchus anatinus]
MEMQSESMAVENHLQFPVLVQRSPPGEGSTRERIKAKLRKNFVCTTGKLKAMILDFFPVVGWLPHYRFKEYIWGDIMSGLIIGIILVPQAIAYSLLAGLKPIYCLYTSFFANIIYFTMGTSRHVSVGIFSLLSLMVGQVVDRELQLAGFDLNDDMPAGNASGMNLTTVPLTLGGMGVECGKECYAISIATALTFLAGAYQVLMGLFHLGFISMYLSEPLLDGFATGASLTILTSQVKYLFGIRIPRHHGYGMFLVTWINLFQNISQANVCDVVTSAICLVVLVAAKELTDRYKQQLKIPLPIELIVIIVATLISHYGNLNERYASSISGEIPTGFIAPKAPDFQLMRRVALDAVPLAVIGFAFTVSLSEMFAKKFAYTIKANQEMFAIGFCNIIPSFFHSIITSAALAKSLVKTSTGCHTQVSSVVSAVVVLLVLLFFAPLFYSLQKCVLACIIIVSLRGALRKFKEVAKQYRLSKIDTLVWCVTMASCALISTEIGLLVGAVFSIMCIVSRTQRPHTALLGQIENTVFYEDDREYENLLPVLKIKVFRFEAPLYYANKDFFVRSLYRMTGLDPVLETAKRKKGAKGKRIHPEKGNEEEASWKGLSQIDTTSSLVPNQVDFQTIIIDCSSVLFLDTAGINTFKEIAKDYKEVNIAVLLACCNPSVIDSLKRGGYFGNAEITKELVFYSVHSAIQFVREREGMADSTV